MSGKSITSQYEDSGLLGRMGFGRRPALLIVDLSRGFTDPTSPLGSDLSDVIRENQRLLKLARARQVPVFFTTMGYTDPEREIGPWLRKAPGLRHLKEGTPWLDIDERVAPAPGEMVITKKFTSSFHNTNLAAMLVAARVDTVIVTGCVTSGCVRQAAIDSTQHGFFTIVPRQAVGDRALGPHEASLFDLNAKWADVLDVDEVCRYLESLPSGGGDAR